ncbi:hypothetical protein [Streptomyces litmocidini]|uniref:Uncharacterized protein n=1 Tax=Streptomyces litmocidini TaxID=67318 RepID=A0ABW7TYI5_9ACTN
MSGKGGRGGRECCHAADQSGLSRRYGGIRFEQGDLDARATGRACGESAWELARRHFDGTAQKDVP